MNRKTVLTLLSMILILSFVLTACSTPAAPAPAATTAPVAEPTKAPVASRPRPADADRGPCPDDCARAHQGA